MKNIKIGLVLSAFALFIFACNQAANTNNTANNAANNSANNSKPVANNNNQTNAPMDEAALGATTYKQFCANCHKEDGTGGKVTIEGKTINAENLTTDKMKNMSDEKYVGYIENGIPDEGMPAFKGRLTDDKIKAVIKHIRTNLQSK